MRIARGFAVCVLNLALVTSYLSADDAKDKKGDDSVLNIKLTGKATEGSFLAGRINFRKELGIPFDYLDNLGQRIYQARKTPDPVELALAAHALSVAEKVSGKKASLTSETVMSEAFDLALRRGISSELTAVAMLATSQDKKKELDEESKSANKRELAMKKATEAGEVSRQIAGTVQVINRTEWAMSIYLNGFPLGVVFPGQTRNFAAFSTTPSDFYEVFVAETGELYHAKEEVGRTRFYRILITP